MPSRTCDFKFFDSRKAGLHPVRSRAAGFDGRIVEDARAVSATGGSLAKYAIEAGKPGAVKA